MIGGNAEVGKDGERLPPVAACLAGVTEGVPGMAEAVREHGQFVFPADEVPGQPGQFPRHGEPSGARWRRGFRKGGPGLPRDPAR